MIFIRICVWINLFKAPTHRLQYPLSIDHPCIGHPNFDPKTHIYICICIIYIYIIYIYVYIYMCIYIYIYTSYYIYIYMYI